MKKSILVLALGCVSAAILPGHSVAQGIRNQTSLEGTQSNEAPIQVAAFSYNSFDPAIANAADVSVVSLKAIKDFKGRFANAKDEKWYTLKGGFLSYFTQEGSAVRAIYDKKGHWQASLKFCSENKLPHDIRAIVKSTYYDFAISVVELIEVPDHCVYIVHLEDATNIKIVRVNEESEMDVLEDYIKP
jgi:hypothetical protein